MEKEKWLMPMYYKDFKCKCEKCRHTCCHSWKIPVSQDEYFKLIGMECSEELHNKIEVAFEDPKIPSPNCYKYISFNWLGECKLNEGGLCMLHAKAGEDKLPKICRLYPRSLKKVNGQLIASCSSSCEAVVEMLYKANSLDMVEDYLDEEPQLEYNIAIKEYKELETFSELLKDRSTSLVRSIIDMCLIVNEKEFKEGYNADINPITSTLNIMERFIESDEFFSSIYNELNERYKDNYFQYEIDKELFEKTYTNWNHFFENVINNSLLYENFPFVDSRFDKTKAYKGLCASYGLLRFVSIGYTSIHKGEEALIDVVAELFHLIDHTAFYYNINVICDDAAILLKL